MRAQVLRVVRIAVLGALLTTMGATWAWGAERESTLENIQKSGVFHAGVRNDYPPYGTIDSTGKPVGFGPDLARAIAEKLKARVEFVPVTSKTRIPLLLNGSIDADIGPTTRTKEREEVIDFSIVYVWDEGTLLVRKGESRDPRAYGPPKTVATTQGSLFVDLFKEVVPNAQFRLFQEYPDAAVALLNKQVDAVIINKYPAASFAKKFPGLVVGETFFRDPIGIGVRQNDSKWRNFINWTLQEFWLAGRYQKMFEANFGYPPDFPLWSPYRLQPGIGK